MSGNNFLANKINTYLFIFGHFCICSPSSNVQAHIELQFSKGKSNHFSRLHTVLSFNKITRKSVNMLFLYTCSSKFCSKYSEEIHLNPYKFTLWQEFPALVKKNPAMHMLPFWICQCLCFLLPSNSCSLKWNPRALGVSDNVSDIPK